MNFFIQWTLQNVYIILIIYILKDGRKYCFGVNTKKRDFSLSPLYLWRHFLQQRHRGQTEEWSTAPSWRCDTFLLSIMALVWALHKFRHYIYGNKFFVRTNNSALKWLCEKRELTGKYAQYILSLQQYDFEDNQIKGSSNLVANAFSRNPYVSRAEASKCGTQREVISVFVAELKFTANVRHNKYRRVWVWFRNTKSLDGKSIVLCSSLVQGN